MATNITKTKGGRWYAVQICNWFSIQSSPGYEGNNILDASDCDEAEANANLMAASPLLEKALQDLVDWVEDQRGLTIDDEMKFRELCGNAHEALSAARGE